jgi:hypothetical protein
MDRYDDDRHDDDRYDDGSYQDDAYHEGDNIEVEPSASDEALDHLWNAAHELLRAVRMIVDAADEFVASQRAAASGRVSREDAPEHGPRVRRIDIDGRYGGDDSGDRPSGSPGAPGTPGAAPY